MKQIVQNLKTGETSLEEVPVPLCGPKEIRIQTRCSLVSRGTERMLVEFGKAGWIDKARRQPEKFQQVIHKLKNEGIRPTLRAVFDKLNKPLPLGYCNVGVVDDVGADVQGFSVGDRVASNGPHAEYVCVPENLCAPVPDNVTDDQAVFTVVGAIGLQGLRLCKPSFGETVVVIGLGLIGLVSAKLLQASGCRVIGCDVNQGKVDFACSQGIRAINTSSGHTDSVSFVRDATDAVGADGVLIAASSGSDEIIHQASEMSRKRGRIILLGVVDLKIRRNDFYEKELRFQVSCSYGPGRYDPDYEDKGQDYPIGFVRWTEKRNFVAVLSALSSGKLKVDPLISDKVPLENFQKVYGNLGESRAIASILVYPDQSPKTSRIVVSQPSFKKGEGVLGIIGAGNYTSSTVVPALKAAGANLKYIASAGGLSAKNLARKGSISTAVTDYREILKDETVDTVLIVTRHNLHSRLIQESLKAGKHVFVEKPLCLNRDELNEIVELHNEENKNTGRQIFVGFNRRFSPLAIKMKEILGEGPKNIVATMNAGHIPEDSWVHDMEEGGGRIIGEACHYIDLCTFLSGGRIQKVCMNALGICPARNTDNATILLKYDNGTNAVINYFANGNKSYPKERIEVYSHQKTLIIDNWKVLRAFGVKGFSKMKTRFGKGQREQFKRLIKAVVESKPLIPMDEIVNTTMAGFAALDSLKKNAWTEIQ